MSFWEASEPFTSSVDCHMFQTFSLNNYHISSINWLISLAGPHPWTALATGWLANGMTWDEEIDNHQKLAEKLVMGLDEQIWILLINVGA